MGTDDILYLKADVQAFQEECTKDLEAAEPVIADAEAALNSLDKASLGELKSFGSPAAEVVQASIYLDLSSHMINIVQLYICGIHCTVCN